MGLPIAGISFYYEGSDLALNQQSRAQTTFNKRGTPVGSGQGFPGRNLLRVGFSSAKGTGDLYFFHDENSDIATYKKQLYGSADTAKVEVNDSVQVSDVLPRLTLLRTFVTEPGIPGAQTVSGQWVISLRCKLTLDGPTITEMVRLRIYQRDLDDVETLLNDQATSVAGTTEHMKTFLYTSSGTWLSTDRLVFKVYAYFELIGNLE